MGDEEDEGGWMGMRWNEEEWGGGGEGMKEDEEG